MKKILCTILVITFVILSFASCSRSYVAPDEDVPLSIASPIANLEVIFHSAPSTDGKVRLTGLEDAVLANSNVVALNETTLQTESTTADANGGFQMEISASANDVITVLVNSVEVTDSTNFTVSATDPTPLYVNQTDVSIFQSQNLAYVTVTGSSTTSLVELNLTTGLVTSTHLLTEAETGAALTDVIGIEVFENAKLALVIDKTLAKFYLVDLSTLTVKADPIEITGNFAKILTQNSIKFHFGFNNVAETEELIRQGILGIVTTLNNKLGKLPDANTAVVLDGVIGSSSSQLLFAGTLSNVGTLVNFSFQNSDLAILSEKTLALFSGTVGGLAVFDDRSQALIANQAKQVARGDQKAYYVCDLNEMVKTKTLLIDGLPSELVTSPDQSKIYAALNDTHQLITIDTTDFTISDTKALGPNPDRIAIGSQGDTATALNSGDTTVSFVRF